MNQKFRHVHFVGIGGIGMCGIAELLLNETPNGVAISIMLHEIETLEFHWEYVPEIFQDDVDVLEDLIREQLIDALLADMIGQPLGDFVIPEINLGDLSPMFGTGVVLAPLLNELTHVEGHTLIQGELE